MSVLKRALLRINVLMGVIGVSLIVADFSFKRSVRAEVARLFDNVTENDERVTEEDIIDLPIGVQRWLTYSGVIGRERLRSARLKQRAEMRMEAGSRWMPVEAEQYFTADKPGFIWSATIKAAPFIHISGRDKYQNGKGSMLIKPMSLFTVADSKGKEVDQGTLLRYLAETMWFPSAALNDYIQWVEVDDNNVKATMSYLETTASGIFSINELGEVTNFEAERYGEFDGDYRLETWSIPVTDYRTFQGIKVPTKGEITWKLDEGDFNWFNFEVMELEYNEPSAY